MSLHQLANRLWYDHHPLSCLLLPFSWLYRVLIFLRRLLYSSGLIAMHKVAAPVIVVGNISVGGAGKTPLVIWLAAFLENQGYRPGIISTGYGGAGVGRAQAVYPDSEPAAVGDEAVLLAKRTALPVVVAANRYLAARQLLEHHQCDILLCDDGLQDYGLKHDIGIVVIDGERRFGNRHCLPAGPLREPVSRLAAFDLQVAKGRAGKHEYLMQYEYDRLHSLDDMQMLGLDALVGRPVHAVAGLGNPERFFAFLHAQGVQLIRHEFPDHYQYEQNDIVFHDDLAVVMTEKDAVKCRRFAGEGQWYLPIQAVMSHAFEHRLQILLQEIADG